MEGRPAMHSGSCSHVTTSEALDKGLSSSLLAVDKHMPRRTCLRLSSFLVPGSSLGSATPAPPCPLPNTSQAAFASPIRAPTIFILTTQRA